MFNENTPHTANDNGKSKLPALTLVPHEPKHDTDKEAGISQAARTMMQKHGGRMSATVDMVWTPKKPGEEIIGEVTSCNEMEKGGLAVTVRASYLSGEKTEPPCNILLKGGSVILRKFRELSIGPGYGVVIHYKGEVDVNQPSPMRDFEVIALGQVKQ